MGKKGSPGVSKCNGGCEKKIAYIIFFEWQKRGYIYIYILEKKVQMILYPQFGI
jgi:hypothetical protein